MDCDSGVSSLLAGKIVLMAAPWTMMLLLGHGMRMGCTYLVLGEEGVAHSCEQHHPHEEGDYSLGGHCGTGALELCRRYKV